MMSKGSSSGIGFRKGVLGIKEDIDVMLGADQKTEAVFRARKEADSMGRRSRKYL